MFEIRGADVEFEAMLRVSVRLALAGAVPPPETAALPLGVGIPQENGEEPALAAGTPIEPMRLALARGVLLAIVGYVERLFVCTVLRVNL
jgi:hypothetical protein